MATIRNVRKPKKAKKQASTTPAKPRLKPSKSKAKVTPKARPAKRAKAPPKPKPQASPARPPIRRSHGAVTALEEGIKMMYAEDYAKAVKVFNKVITDYPGEAEIQASAKARIQACEKKLQERSRTIYRSADDHYNVAVAFLNQGELDAAVSHLQSALKLAPKADYILYAMAAANALKGNKDQALTYLKQSIHHRPENRFQAVLDHDFAALAEEPAFKDLVAPRDK